MNKYIAEALGAFALTLTALFSLQNGMPMGVAALTLGLMVYILGPISGSHLNPAVTLGLWSVKKINNIDAAAYIFAQFVGAVIAMLIIGQIFALPVLPVDDTMKIALAEMLGTFFLVFAYGGVISKLVPEDMSGLTIAGSLLLGFILAATMSNGILNPALALALRSFNIAYVVGPIIGGVIGAWALKGLNSKI